MNWQKIFTSPVFWIVALAALAAFLFWRLSGRVKLPDSGAGIPAGWSPVTPASQLHAALDGFGTDETLFFSTMNGLQTKDMVAAVLNQYNKDFGDLIADIRDEFSGDELTRALSYFNGVVRLRK